MSSVIAEHEGARPARESTLDRARWLAKEGDWSAVVALVESDRAAGLSEPGLLEFGGIAAHNLGDLETAERFYRRAACAHPQTKSYRYLFKIGRQRSAGSPDLTPLRWARVLDPESTVVQGLFSPPAEPPQAGEATDARPMTDAATPAATEAPAAASPKPDGRPGEQPGARVDRWVLAALAPVLLGPFGALAGATLAQAWALPWWWTAVAALAGMVAPALVLEFYGFVRLTGETGQLVGPARRLQGETNSYISQVTEDQGGRKQGFRRRSFASALTPHPYVAYVNKPPRSPDHPLAPNNYGFFNRPFPYERDPGLFQILVSGGSVATQFAQMNRNGPRYLEEALNRRFLPPKGERFVVLNGALGGWRYPQQVGISAMTASAVDAVVTLDGFNEAAMMMRDGVLVETPGRKFLMSNPGLEHGYERMVGDWLASWVYEQSLRHWWTRHSNYFCLVSQGIRRAIPLALEQGDDQSYLLSIFEMPKLGTERRWRYAVQRYADYVRFLHGACRQVGIRSAHFLQPIPGLGKQLTEQEQGYSKPLGDRLVDIYRMMEAAMQSMAADEGVPSASLVNVFQDRTETIYADWPHCLLDRNTGESDGYRLMAEAMAAELGRLWSLREKAPA